MPNLNIICDICDKTFTYKKNLYEHIRNIHKLEPAITIPKNLSCAKCKTMFSSYKDLRKHISVKHDVKMQEIVVTFNNKAGN